MGMNIETFELRAAALEAGARRQPHTADAALRWILLAERTAAHFGQTGLVEALEGHEGAVRNVIARIRREDWTCATAAAVPTRTRGANAGQAAGTAPSTGRPRPTSTTF